jgi:predicted dehydrogenase
MTEDNLRVALIGCGSIAHFIHIPGLRLCPRVSLTFACDSSLETARSTADKFNIPRLTSDYHEVITDPAVDAVIIATPNHLHKPIAIEALAAGKHVLCEKLLGLDAGECAEMVGAAQKSGKVHMVSFVYRFAPALRYMKYLVDRGDLGEIRHFRAFYLQRVPEVWLGWRSQRAQAGSGALGDIGSHLVDFALYLLGDIVSVSSWVKNFLSRRPVWGTDQLVDADVDDAAGFLAMFASGGTGIFEASRLVPGRGVGQNEFQSVEINGSKGSLVYDLQDPFHLQLCTDEPSNPAKLMEIVSVPDQFLKWHDTPRCIADTEPNLGFRYDQAYAFSQAIRGIRPEPLADFNAGWRCQAVIDAVLQAARLRRWVDVKAQID